MRRKRTAGISGTPAEHLRETTSARHMAAQASHEVRVALRAGDCARAFDSLMDAESSISIALNNADGFQLRRAQTVNGGVFRARTAFRARCLCDKAR